MLRNSLKSLGHAVRSVLGIEGLKDRLALIQEQLDPAPTSAGVLNPPARVDPNLLLHNSRGAMLRAMPSGVRRLLSAGCSGRWYFDWVEQCYGRVPEHIGIEYYTPRPDSLPDNVTWIENTVSDMSDVESVSCDLVFSGQNIEHLWPDEVAGFLNESARVLRPGGYLVVDSPNRALTAPLNWSHPEHTIELTLEEIGQLLRLSGFDTTKAAGIWLCRDPRTGRLLPFDPNDKELDWTITERLIAAHDNPESAFIWWVEARRNERVPDRLAIESMLSDIFRAHWPERVQRLVVAAGRSCERRGDEDWVISEAGRAGVVFFGPYMPLRAGRYRCTFQLRPPSDAAAPFARCDVVAGPEGTPLVAVDAAPGETEVGLAFELECLTFGIQFRCISLGRAGFSVRRQIMLEEPPNK